MINLSQLEEQLTKLPGQIREQAKVYLEKKTVVEVSKLQLDVATSNAMLESQEPNATRQKAESVVKTQDEKRRFLKDQLEMERAEVELKYLEDRFTSMRKIGSLESDMMRSQLGGN